MSENNLFMMVDKDQLQEVVETAVRNALNTKSESPRAESDQLGEYVSQMVAMKILNRKTTWFHLKRKSGELTAIKSANQWWYKRSDLEDYVKNGIEYDSRYKQR